MDFKVGRVMDTSEGIVSIIEQPSKNTFLIKYNKEPESLRLTYRSHLDKIFEGYIIE